MRVKVLGGLEIEDIPSPKAGSRKARTVLKVLALARGQPVSPDRLIDIVWGDDPPTRPTDQLSVLVSRLRAAFGANRLPRVDGGYVLRADWLDIAELDTRVAEASARLAAGAPAAAGAAANAALALVRGPLLADDEGSWLEAERTAAERTATRARLIAAEAALAVGDPTRAASDAARALAADPYDEAALGLLMKAHAAAGRPASALAAYAETRHRLAEDLGVSPTEETESLHSRILRGDRVEPSGPRPAPRAIVGRDGELERLNSFAAEVQVGGSLLVAVDGEAGIGKTVLVERWAGDLSDAFVMKVGCDELGRDLPLQPILNGLETHLGALTTAEAEIVMGEHAPRVAALLGMQPSAPPDPTFTSLPDPATSRGALYSALLAVIERAAHGRTIALVVDDVHWADGLTLEWLAFVRRRARSCLIVVTRRSGGAGKIRPDRAVTLGPLDLDTARRLVGDGLTTGTYERSEGNPLFLLALADAVEDSLPTSIIDAVTHQARGLGDAAVTLTTAAVLDADVDVALLAEVLGRSPAELLDDLEGACRAGLLREAPQGFAFAHGVTREALAAAASAPRQAFIHLEAARVLSGVPRASPLELARHARLGGDRELAALALTDAAGRAAARFDHRTVVDLLTDAVALDDSPDVRLARARALLAIRRLDDAADDAQAAIDDGAGAAGLELAGWIAYYRRDLAVAGCYADEGALRADQPGLRASCLCLAGRVRQSLGDLAGAEARLSEALSKAPPTLRPLAELWSADLCAHQGRPSRAKDLADRGLLDRTLLQHPFAVPHGLMTRAYAWGMTGDVAASFAATDRFLGEMERLGDLGARYVPPACNFRAWVLRSVGRLSEARDLNEQARDLSHSSGLKESFNQAALDLADGYLLSGDHDAACRALDELRPVDENAGVMLWHQQERRLLLRARLELAQGDPAGAVRHATEAAALANQRGSDRHARLASVVRALALLDASGSGHADAVQIAHLPATLDPVAGLEAWRWSAELARRIGTDSLWQAARRRAAALVGTASADVRPDLERWIDRYLDQRKRPPP